MTDPMKDNKSNKIELLAPAGNVEKLEIAIHYGADAVYLAGTDFSLRNFSGNFSLEEMKAARQLTKDRQVKMYVAVNIYSRNHEQESITGYLEKLQKIGPDAIIVADPGIFMEVKRVLPQMPIHVSTQSNTTNYKTAQFWKDLGASRINTARELPLEEIKEISQKCDIEVESFVHGAMCISYSGRCLLSSFMTKRESNRGMCSQPCRYHYTVMEAKRPGQYFPIAEDDRGAYIFNSRDLCMVGHIPELVQAGIRSLKIEGRMKSINYAATAVKVYREAIDRYYAAPEAFVADDDWFKELHKVSHRGYSTGFYFNDPDQVVPNYADSINPGDLFVGKVLEKTAGGLTKIEVRNKIFEGDDIEILRAREKSKKDRIQYIINADDKKVPFAQPGSRVTLQLEGRYSPLDIIRIKKAGKPSGGSR